VRITTTTAKVTYILAWVIVGLLGVTCWWATTTGALPSTTPFTNPLVAASCLAAAAYYIHSGWRLARHGDVAIGAGHDRDGAHERHP
jgi:hypothetical protein